MRLEIWQRQGGTKLFEVRGAHLEVRDGTNYLTFSLPEGITSAVVLKNAHVIVKDGASELAYKFLDFASDDMRRVTYRDDGPNDRNPSAERV